MAEFEDLRGLRRAPSLVACVIFIVACQIVACEAQTWTSLGPSPLVGATGPPAGYGRLPWTRPTQVIGCWERLPEASGKPAIAAQTGIQSPIPNRTSTSVRWRSHQALLTSSTPARERRGGPSRRILDRGF